MSEPRKKGIFSLLGNNEAGMLGGAFAILSQNTMVTGIGFLTSILMARWLGPAQLGFLYVVNLIPLYAEKFGRVGLIDHATVYYIGKKKYGPGLAAGHLTLLFAGFSLVAVFGYAIFQQQFYDSFLKTTTVPHFYVWTAVATIPALLLIVAYGKLQLSLNLIRSYNVSQLMRPVLFLVTVFFFWLYKWDFYGAVLAGFVSVWAAVFVAGASLWRVEKFSFKPNVQFVTDVFKFGWGMYAITILQFLQERFDLVVIARYLTKTEMSYYSLAVGISLLLIKLPGAVATLLYPRVTRQNEAEAAAFTARVCRINLFICAAAGIALALVAFPVVRLFFGERYLGIIPPLVILIPGTILLGLSRLLTEHFYGIGKPRLIILPCLMTTIFNVMLNFLLTPRFGINTAALISGGTYSLYFVLLAFRFSRACGVTWRELVFVTFADIRQVVHTVFPPKPL